MAEGLIKFPLWKIMEANLTLPPKKKKSAIKESIYSTERKTIDFDIDAYRER